MNKNRFNQFKPLFGLFFLLIYSQATYAIFCPSNFTIIDFGDSMESVEKVCKPDEKKTREIEPPDTGPQNWTYYVNQDPTVATRMQLSVVFTDGKIINISVNGAGVSTTDLCGGNIQTGDTMATVKTNCGDPSFIDKGVKNKNAVEQKPTMDTDFIYHTTPITTLTFEDGKLKSRTP